MRHHPGQSQVAQTQSPEGDRVELFTNAFLHGLKARLRNDVGSLKSYLPPQVAQLA